MISVLFTIWIYIDVDDYILEISKRPNRRVQILHRRATRFIRGIDENNHYLENNV